ncbi:MAG: hypothetical protein SF051_12670, partial [Elusimicrobiota bacterium]|nr:hypothetical protein [Elusimicrobiota bacterium]
MRRVLLLALLAAACGPEPDRGLLYAHPEARAPFFVLDREAGVWRAARTGASEASFPAVKAPGTFRVFVLGGSIARMFEGDGALADALTPLLPGRTVEVLNAGMSGYDSAREELIAREVLDLGADAVVLLSGHNEFTTLPPPLPLWRLRLGLWAAARGLVRRPAASPRDELPRAAARLAAFEASVRRMARAARARGVAFVVVRPPLNLRDGAPQGALPRRADFATGWMRRLMGDCRGARAAWAAARPTDPVDAAVIEFLTARCHEREGRSRDAAAAYARALELEAPLRGRCGAACAAVLARVAAEEGALYADAHADFLALSGALPPGLEAFHDRIHWRPERHPVVARSVAKALAGAGLCAAPGPRPPAPPSPPRGPQGWLTVLRYAAWETQNAAPAPSPVALAFIERALEGWPGAAARPALLEELAEDSRRQGGAWGQPGLERAGPGFARHLSLARLLAGDAPGAAALLARSGASAHWEDRLHAAAALAAAGRRAGAVAELEAAWALGEGAPDEARDEVLRAAAAALPVGLRP